MEGGKFLFWDTKENRDAGPDRKSAANGMFLDVEA